MTFEGLSEETIRAFEEAFPDILGPNDEQPVVSEPPVTNHSIEEIIQLAQSVEISCQITTEVDEEKIAKIKSFLQRLSVVYEEQFNTMLDYDHLNSPNIVPTSVVEYVKSHGLNKARFTITDTVGINEMFALVGRERLLQDDPNGIYVVFNLPKPASVFWQKSEYRTKNTAINWGSYYDGTIDLIREAISGHAYEDIFQRGDLEFDRLNPNKDHFPNYYYYVYKVEEAR